MRHTFTTEQWVPYPIGEVFAFFANPGNLPKLMPSWQDARIEKANYIPPPPAQTQTPKTPAAGAGSTLTITFRPVPLSPIRLSWQALITDFAWNDHFCDEQPKGPFAYWHHCHHVKEEKREETPGTLVQDKLIYQLPLGILAEPAHTLFVRGQIHAIFRYRQKRLLELMRVESPV